MSAFCYCGSDTPVRVGDRILIHRRFGRSRLGTVVYVPGQVDPDPELGRDQWAFKTDDGTVYATTYAPDQVPQAERSIEFVFRAGDEATAVIHSYRIPPEPPTGQVGRDFLALIGCGVVGVIVLGVGAMVAWWVAGP